MRPLKYQPTDFIDQHKETTTCSVLPVCCVISVICLVSSLSSLELCSILCSSCRLEEPPFRASKDHEMTMLNNQMLFQSTIRKLSQQKLRAAPSLQPEPCRSHRPYLGHSKSFKVIQSHQDSSTAVQEVKRFTRVPPFQLLRNEVKHVQMFSGSDPLCTKLGWECHSPPQLLGTNVTAVKTGSR